MIFGAFFGKTVPQIERHLGKIEKVAEKLEAAKNLAHIDVGKAVADRLTAIAELKKDLDALAAVRAKLG